MKSGTIMWHKRINVLSGDMAANYLLSKGKPKALLERWAAELEAIAEEMKQEAKRREL